ncbi:MAG: LPS assembly protein LptD, partial [Gammaproteobacteria bacterium]
VDFTTCDPDLDGPWNLTTNIWKITARELTLNHETERGTGKHVVLKLKDIPVFYTPYLSFPMSDERKSGFLFPAFGASSRYGVELETPYYWNIAPQMDATISPRLLSNSGVMLSGEYRYLFRRGEGILNLEYLPDDKSFEGEDRGSIAFEHRQSFLNAGRLVMKYNRVSDQEYFEDFGDSLLRTSTRYLEQSAIASYRWNLAGHRLNLYNTIDNYQIIDQSIRITSRPYRRLPSTTLTYNSPFRSGRFNYDMTTKLDYFTRGEDPQLNNVNGFRYDLFPSISFPIQNIAYNLTPKAGLRFTQYHLEENTRFDDDAPNRVLPYFSLDGTVFLERTTRLFGMDILQTLEPRLYYLYVPEKDQSELPVFDTRQYGTTYASLFYQDRFNGPDRFGDTNQATFAVSSRIYSDTTGRQLAHFSLGQTYYLKDRTVVLPGRQIQEDRVSALISEFGTTWFDDLYIRGEVQWDPNINFIQKMSLNTQYQPARGKVLNVGYRVNRTSPDARVTNLLRVEQADVSFSWPLKDSWNLVGRWNYAIEESRTLDTFAGVEYNSCCWGFRAVARRFLSNLDGDFEM